MRVSGKSLSLPPTRNANSASENFRKENLVELLATEK